MHCNNPETVSTLNRYYIVLCKKIRNHNFVDSFAASIGI